MSALGLLGLGLRGGGGGQRAIAACLRGHLHPADLSGSWAPCGPPARAQLSRAIPGAVATTAHSQGRKQGRAPRCQPPPPGLLHPGVPLSPPPSPWLWWGAGPRPWSKPELQRGPGDRLGGPETGGTEGLFPAQGLGSGLRAPCRRVRLLHRPRGTRHLTFGTLAPSQGPQVSWAAQGPVFLPSGFQRGPWANVGPSAWGWGCWVQQHPHGGDRWGGKGNDAADTAPSGSQPRLPVPERPQPRRQQPRPGTR